MKAEGERNKVQDGKSKKQKTRHKKKPKAQDEKLTKTKIAPQLGSNFI